MKTTKLLLFNLLLSTLLFSCNNNKIQKILLPSVSGKSGDVLMVIDMPYWEAELGNDLRFLLTKEYPYLPQREPLFNLYNAPHKAFSGSFVTHRNIIVVNVGEKYDTAEVSIKKDVWAAPQLVITVSAPDQESARKIVAEKSEIITNALEQSERDRIIASSKKYQEVNLRSIVLEKHGKSPYFPKGFSLKKNTKDFTWISYETTYINRGIFIYEYDYNSAADITTSGIIKHRNEMLQANVPGMFDNSYMTTGNFFPPTTKWITYKNNSFAETRGLWEVQNDYMGGPFISHCHIDEERGKIIVIEGFVYAPKHDKRNYLRYVEAVLYSFE